MGVRAIFWDNDGVLVDTEALYFQACAETLAACGVELSREDFIEISLRKGESVFSLAREADEDRLRSRRNERYAELLSTRDLVLPGVERVLQALHGRVRMAVVTSSLRSHFEIIHRNSGLLPYFDFVLTREDYRLSKPHPEPYLAALNKSGIPAADCLVVEDSPRGLEAAAAAGLPCCVIPSDLTAGGDFTAADHIISSIHQLPAVILDRSSTVEKTT